MSRAFVKEDDVGAGATPPERPHSPQPALITGAGLAELKRRFATLLEERDRLVRTGTGDETVASLERDLRYLRLRIERAIVVPPSAATADEVRFGATVTVRRSDGTSEEVTIVGEDEADPRRRRVSWTSPLGRALLGARIGETVTWSRPAGEVELTVLRLHYESLTATVD